MRRVFCLAVAFIAFVLAMCRPFGFGQSAWPLLFNDWWPSWSSDWPFGGTWPFALTALLACTSCLAVTVMLCRFPGRPVPRRIRRLHYLVTTISEVFLAFYATFGVVTTGSLPFLESGEWFFVLGCVALAASTARLAGPKPAPAATI